MIISVRYWDFYGNVVFVCDVCFSFLNLLFFGVLLIEDVLIDIEG